MKTASIFLGILLSLLLLVSLCFAAEDKVAEFQPAKGGGVRTKNGEEDQDEKFKFLYPHKPYFKKPFFKPFPYKFPIVKKPIPQPIPYKFPIVKKPIPQPIPYKFPIVKKPIPQHPLFKKPIPQHPLLKKPFPPIFSSHP